MAWTIEYAESALRELRKLDPTVARRVVDFMSERVAKHPDPRSIGSPLTGPLLGQFWRYRVGDMGSTLSGGQKQRVLIARALYQRPRILILDEGTSHLDVDTERAVNAALSALSITRIVVAHRPDTIRAAGRVLSLQGGVVRDMTVNQTQEKTDACINDG